jgi:hypothetical protein
MKFSLFYLAVLVVIQAAPAVVLGQPQCHSQFRRDYFLSDWTYPESWAPDPVTGGRVHLVFPITASNAGLANGPFTVSIGGYNIPISHDTDISSITSNNVQWIHFEASTATGVVSLHSPTDSFVTGMGTVSVYNAKGALVGACVSDISDLSSASAAPVTLSYVTSRKSWTEMVVHVHNNDLVSAHTMSQMVVNGVRGAGIHPTLIPPQGHQVFVVPLGSAALGEGSGWTVELFIDNSSWIGNGGRLGKEVMFVEGWQHSQMCPFPVSGGQASDFFQFRDTLGMNAFWGFSACTDNYQQVLDNATANGYYIILTSVENFPHISDTSRLMCVEAGDEVDNKLTDLPSQWRKVLSIRKDYPNVVVYQGGKTNHWAGAFAGSSDIQGIDFYIGACAPHITPFLSAMPLTGSRDYLRNSRNNQMPLPMWGYSQAICTNCWNTIPNSADFTIQIASAFIAGTKSLMLFMADDKSIGMQAFSDGGSLIRSFNAVREEIRTGDIQGAVKMTTSPASAQVLMETIAAPNNTFVIVIANGNGSGYSDITCEIGIENHWVFTPQTLDGVEIVVTPSAQSAAPSRIVAALEALNGSLQPPSSGATIAFNAETSTISISNVQLENVDIVARIFYVQLS